MSHKKQHVVDGLSFAVRDGAQGQWDRGIIDEVVRADCYRIKRWLPQNTATVLDVGAHIGSFSRWFALRSPTTRVYSFEPFAPNFALLQENVAGLQNVVTRNVALGNRNGTVRFCVPVENTGGGGTDWATSEGDVACIDVADVIAEIGYVDCLKMDCEGSEFTILPRIHSLDGGLRAHVGCVRAEVHAIAGSAHHTEFMNLLKGSFPFTDEQRLTQNQSLVFAWR